MLFLHESHDYDRNEDARATSDRNKDSVHRVRQISMSSLEIGSYIKPTDGLNYGEDDTVLEDILRSIGLFDRAFTSRIGVSR